MLGRASPFRVLLTALLVAAVPLCCCSFRSWLGGLGGLGGGMGGCHAGAVAVVAAAAAGGQEASCCGHAGDAAGGADRSGSEPTAPADGPDEPCSCGKQYTSSESKVLTVDSVAPAAASVFIAVAHDQSFPALNLRPVRDTAIVRPQASLLRLHCALIV